MTCEILTGERFERLLSHRATREDIELLRAHFDTACEACLDRLAGVDDERLLAALAGPNAELTKEEADQMFEAVRPVDRRLLARLMRWPLAAAASLLVVGLASMVYFRDPNDFTDKGVAPHVELMAYGAKKVGDSAAIERRLEDGARLAPEEHVLFRYRLSAPAHFYLVVKTERAEEMLFTVEAEAGEHEVAKKGAALALDPKGMGSKFRVIAIASEDPIERAWSSCTICGRAELELVNE